MNRLLLIAVLLVGCGYDSPPVGVRISPPVSLPDGTVTPQDVNDMTPPGNMSSKSGSRLRRVWITADDGAQQTTRDFWDTQLSIKCHFVQMADITQRCLPSDLLTPILYLDPECTKPIFIEPKCSPATSIVTWAKPNFGGPRGRGCRYSNADIHVNQADEIPTDNWPQVVYFFGQACDAVRPNLDFTKRVFVPGVELPITNFVGAASQIE